MKYAIALLALLPVPSLFADEGFEKHIRPLLADHCIRCHGPTKQSGGLRLDSRDAILKGGDTGPIVVVGYKDELRMPPISRLRHYSSI